MRVIKEHAFVPPDHTLEVRRMQTPWDWKSFFLETGCFPYEPEGHTGPDAPHTFRFLEWPGLKVPMEVPDQHGERNLKKGDIVFIQKRYMARATLLGSPQTFLPAECRQQLPPQPTKEDSRNAIGAVTVNERGKNREHGVLKEYRKTGERLSRPACPYGLQRAGKYLLDYINGATRAPATPLQPIFQKVSRNNAAINFSTLPMLAQLDVGNPVTMKIRPKPRPHKKSDAGQKEPMLKYTCQKCKGGKATKAAKCQNPCPQKPAASAAPEKAPMSGNNFGKKRPRSPDAAEELEGSVRSVGSEDDLPRSDASVGSVLLLRFYSLYFTSP